MAKLSPVDKVIDIPSDWNPNKLETQSDADNWARKNGFDVVMVTSDKCIYKMEDADHARNHAVNNRLKIFTVNLI